MIDTLLALFQQFTEYSKVNPVIAGIAGVWGAGVTTFFLRSLPSRIFNKIKYYTTTSLTINNYSKNYHYLLDIIYENKINILSRSFNYLDEASDLTLGFGTNYVYFKRKIFKVVRTREKLENKLEDKETLEITGIGFTKSIFENILKECDTRRNKDDQDDDISIYKCNPDEAFWMHFKDLTNTTPRQVILPESTRSKLYNHIEKFSRNKKWYTDRGLIYKTGIILEGPPGTGKTSTIIHLAQKYNKNIYIYPVEALRSSELLEKSLRNMSTNSLVVLEDIDTVIQNRDSEKNDTTVNFSKILNTFDGITSPDNCIFIATTNHYNRLDPAFTRPGRFDITLHLGYCDYEQARDIMKSYFPDYKFPKNIKLKKNLTPAIMQSYFLENTNDPEALVEKIRE